jgi:hypothetical protein
MEPTSQGRHILFIIYNLLTALSIAQMIQYRIIGRLGNHELEWMWNKHGLIWEVSRIYTEELKITLKPPSQGNRARSYSSNSIDLYLGGAPFESRQGNRPPCSCFPWFSSRVRGK